MPDETILVVDDDRTMRELAAELLRDEGYRVVACADAEAGLAAIGRRPIALVLLNPGAAAADDAAVVRAAHRAAGRVPVLLWSGWPEPAAQAAALGAEGAVPKPTDLEELLARVREGLGDP